MDQICIYCNIKFWMQKKDYKSNRTSSKLIICCVSNIVHLSPLYKPSSYLLDLYTLLKFDADSFRKNIRDYNSILACISFRANIDKEFQRSGVSNFQIHG